MKEEKWTIEIEPAAGSLKKELHELWEYRQLIKMFVKRDLKTMYAQTVLGPLWFVINSILSASVMTIVFDKIAGISTDGIPGFLFYMAGNILWSDFAACITGIADTFTKNVRLMGKVYFPRLCVPISTILSKQLRLIIQLIVFIILYLLGTDGALSWRVLFTPFLVIELMALALGCGIIMASFTTKYKDLTVLVTFFMQIWMYATPIVYPASKIPESLRMVFMLNPVAPIVETFRIIWFGNGTVPTMYLVISVVMTVLILAVGIVLFQRAQRNFLDTV